MAHFEAVVGDVGPASSFERRHAFLTAGPEMVSFLQRLRRAASSTAPATATTTRTPRAATTSAGPSSRCPGTAGRSVTWLRKLQPGLAQSLGLAVMTNEARSLSHYNRSVARFADLGPGGDPHATRAKAGGRRCSPTAPR